MGRDRILIIDDEPALREVLGMVLGRAGYEVREASSGEAGLLAFDHWGPDLVVSDLTMPGIDGIEVLRQLRVRAAQAGRDVPVILVTAYGSTATAVAAMKEGAFDYVTKPFQNDELRMLVAKALAMRKLEADNARLRAELGDRYGFAQLVGTSPPMQEVYALVRRVMGTRINCLVCGESGTGKELIARSVHHGSERRGGPFVAMNCGAIPETLFESELFGYKKGAFTGASADKLGFFAAADGGTLFLDEIGEMPIQAQVKVLRALAERKVTPVGGTEEVAVDVRVVAATNRDLVAEVKAGRFREDLYYRLNVVQIDMPPLRERGDDILTLATHFVEKFAEEYGKPLRGLTPEAQRLLRAYAFPGNVRELQNIVERAVALESGVVVSAGALPERLHGGLAPGAGETDDEPFPESGVDLEARLGGVERRYIERALAAAGGNRTQAARLLGVTFRSFRYRLIKFGLAQEGDAE
ncbi:MAG: sigma-54-dependent Fis family transcriptional regulator [Deltaproteobacteria bacterium]|nr:sigma-54-dependent Fis family transcriptional regulator [Deltaproteobacteria bacterium]